MYLPPAFKIADVAHSHAVIDRHPFALLVTTDADGAPHASPLPLLLERVDGTLGRLTGHLARANPQAAQLAAHAASGRPVLTVFQGPHGYISPRWYKAPLAAVPTWNYLSVQARGRVRLLEDPAEFMQLLRTLSERFEAGAAQPWQFDALAPNYRDSMMRAILGFEITLDELTGKAKLSQNRSAEDRAGVVAGLEAAGDTEAAGLAALMRSV